jgi:hypothetical protein
MKKSIFKISIIFAALLFVMGVITNIGETDEPGLRGDNSRIVQFM